MDESDAPAAKAVRAEILRRAEAGQSDAEIRSYLVSRYGTDILLRPQGTGVAALVWALPVFAIALAIAGLVVAFRRWRPSGVHPSEADRAIVAEELGR